MKPRLILDCSVRFPGPMLGKLLADEGARVIKIESPARGSKPGDDFREMPAWYEALNSKKEILLLDLTQPRDRTQFDELVRQADGLIEGFRPSVKSKLGLTEKHLHATNPKLCIASIVGYPENSAERDRAGHDLNFQARSGCLSLFSEMPPLPLGALFTAYHGAIRLQAAMDLVSRTASQGQRIVISVLESLKSMQAVFAADFRATGMAPRAANPLTFGEYPCYRIYRTRDGRRITVGATETKFWEAFCEVIQAPNDLKTRAFARGKEGLDTVRQIEQILLTQDWSEWSRRLQGVDCCVEPVLEYPEVFGDGVQP